MIHILEPIRRITLTLAMTCVSIFAISQTCPSLSSLTLLDITNSSTSAPFNMCKGNLGPYTYQASSLVQMDYDWSINGTVVNLNSTITVQGVDIYLNAIGDKLEIMLLNPNVNSNEWSFTLGVLGYYSGTDFPCPVLNKSKLITVKTLCNQIISFGISPSWQCGDGSFNLSTGTSVSSGLPITYTSSKPSVVSISGGVATINGIGTANITASQTGNAVYDAAVPVTQSLTVNGISATISSALSSGSSVNVCSLSPQLTANVGSGAYTYTWSTGQQGQSINVSAPGTYSVTVQNAIAGCTSTTSTAVAILPSPIPTISGPSSVLTSTPLTYTTETGKGNYNWSTSPGGLPYAAPVTTTLTEWHAELIPPQYVTTITTAPGPPAPNNTFSYPVVWSSTGLPQSISVSYTDSNGCSGTSTMQIKYSQSISFDLIPTKNCGESSFNLGATASSGLPITYSSSSPSIASISGSNTVTIHGVGTANITASQLGNSIYNAAVPATQTLIVNGINAKISAPFSSGSLINVCNGGNKLLTASAGNGVYTYSWSTGQIGQSIVVNTPGTYSVSIQNLTPGCSSSATATVAIVPNPVPTISGPSYASGGTSSYFTYLTETGKSNYNWVTSTGGQPYEKPIREWVVDPPPARWVVTGFEPPAPNNIDTYLVNWTALNPQQTISVSYTDANGCTGTSTMQVNAKLNQSISFNSIPATCVSKTLTLSATASSGLPITYESSNPAVASISGNVVTAISAGTTTILASQPGNEVYNAASNVSQLLSVNVVNAAISTSGPTTFCSGGSVTLTASAGSSYLWSTGATSQAITVSASGNYSVKVTNASGCFATSAATVVTVNSLPTVSISPAYVSICAGTSTTLTASGLSNYNWSPSTGLSANTGATVTANPTSTTTYTISGTGANGCTGSRTVTVTVNPRPTPTISGTSSFCSSSSSNYSTQSGSGISSYLWSVTGGGAINSGQGTSSVSVSWISSGSISVSYTSNGCAAAQAATLSVTVSSGSGKIFASPSTNLCTAGYSTLTSNISGGTYSWSTGQFTQSITVYDAGTYSVTVNINGCIKTTSINVTRSGSSCIFVRTEGQEPIAEPIEDLPNVAELSVFPNPAAGQFMVALPERAKEDTPLKFYDMLGKEMISSTIPKGQWKVSVSLENVLEGMYLMKIGNGDGTVKKVMVRK
jgi:large repetitive protein